MIRVKADEEGLRTAAEVLNRGGVAIIPTDTVYGLAASPGNSDAVGRLYSIKGRSGSKPIALLAASQEAVEAFGGRLSPAAKSLAARGWPGALTLVVDCNGSVEGFRVPKHYWTRELCRLCGGVLRTTSANASGGCAVADAAAVGISADVFVDGGRCRGGIASTVVKCTAAGLEILRQGAFAI